jgi:hypothetical protein
MGIDGIGSSVVVALAAVLWFLYLVPTWLKRREYLATERNAVRLQQTMRILAESAELPSVVRVEATARTVAAQQRALRKHQKASSRVSMAFPGESAGRRGRNNLFTEEISRGGRLEGGARTAKRLRRSRALATFVLLGSLVAGGFGVQALVTSGSWLLVTASGIVAIGSFALLGQAAAVSRARAELRRAALASPVSVPLHDHADHVDVRQSRRTGWNPVPVPKPLYLSRSDRGSLVVERSRSDRLETAQPDHAALLIAASAEAERSLRAAHTEPEVARFARPAPAASAPEVEQTNVPAASRFARMGMVDPAAAAPADLDEILRRRRA